MIQIHLKSPKLLNQVHSLLTTLYFRAGRSLHLGDPDFKRVIDKGMREVLSEIERLTLRDEHEKCDFNALSASCDPTLPVEDDAAPNVIREKQYIDVSDLPENARRAYGEFVSSCGVANGQHWPWVVGEADSVQCSWIGKEKVAVIDEALRSFGLSDGDKIALVSGW